MAQESEVRNFYKGKTIFLTGGTGFMGKVFVEKLLYTCPEIRKLYFLIRPKRGKDVDARLEDMFKLPLFGRIQKECPEVLAKVVPIAGDVSTEGLGLTPADEALLVDEVDITVHGAASLRLEGLLKDNINSNTEGTLRVIQLCKRMPKLQLLVHFSTAFSHCDYEVLEEKAYPSPHDPMEVIRMVKWLPDDLLLKITPELMKPHPNSYTYSKRLAEALVASHHPEVPACIVRPSIVTPTWKEPIDGWVDNLNGPTGILVGAGKGVIRSMHCYPDYGAEIMCVDVAINVIIVAIVKLSATAKRQKEIPVLNITNGDKRPVTWGEVVECGKRLSWHYPFEMMLWYPNGSIHTCKFLHDLSAIFYHWLPAYLIDFLMLIFGQKRFMLRIQRKIHDGLEVLQFFTTTKWKFVNKKMFEFYDTLNSIDKRIYFVDIENVDMEKYITSIILGARHYVMKEDPKSLPKYRIIIKILYVIDKLVSAGCYFLLAWLIISRSDAAAKALETVMDFLYNAIPFIRPVQINQ